jgi:hypothetical protein
MIIAAGVKEEIGMQSQRQQGAGRRLLTRCLAAVALVFVYCLGTIGLISTAGTTSAWARGRGGGGGGRGGGGRGGGFVRGGGFRGRGRGFVRGRGVGFYGYYPYYDGCWWSYRYQRWVCPYYY